MMLIKEIGLQIMCSDISVYLLSEEKSIGSDQIV